LWERLVQQSRQKGKQIRIQMFYNNKVHKISGVVKGFIASEKTLLLSTADGEKKVKINNVKAVE
ncbi:MAG: YolD-like family protein, partial [Firmicutes bacterium]|nr:YolD-like family protein [Bacillota bacterium]